MKWAGACGHYGGVIGKPQLSGTWGPPPSPIPDSSFVAPDDKGQMLEMLLFI